MSDRAASHRISFANLGMGTVVLHDSPEDLVQPNAVGVVAPAVTDSLINVRLYRGQAVRRPGYVDIGAPPPDNHPVTGMYWANFGESKTCLIRGSTYASGSNGMLSCYTDSTATWDDISPVGMDLRSSLRQPWAFAMVPRASDVEARWMITGNQGTSIYKWEGFGNVTLLDDMAPTEPKVLVGFLSRAMALNVTDASTGNRKSVRIQWSVVGDSTDWLGLGSGFADLEDDPYPIVAAIVVGGRLAIFKGGRDGGAIYLATPTGLPFNPMRFDMVNPGDNIGPLVPRSCIPVSGNRIFFLGHDAAYIFDGVRALLPFANTTTQRLAQRVNLEAIDTGFARYRREAQEVEVHLAMGSATTPNETWIFNLQEQRAYGPYTYADSFLSSSNWIDYNALTWDTWGQAAARTWDNLTDAAGVEYVAWDNILGTVTDEEAIVYGVTDGEVMTSRGSDTTDDGTNITCTYTTPPVTPDKIPRQSQQGQIMLQQDDVLTLREVIVRHQSTAAWTPIVEVSTNGTTWTQVDDGTAFANTTGRLATKVYYTPTQVGTWFRARVRNQSGALFNVHSIGMRFTYAGSVRHE